MILSAIQGRDLIGAVIWIICLGLIFGLLWWLIDYCKIPEPFNKIVRIVIAIAAVLVLINVLLTVAGHPIVTW